MFRNRMLGGVSFLPLFAAEGAAGGGEVDPAEVAEHGDPEFAEAPEGAAAAAEGGAESAEGAEGAEAAAAAGEAGEGDKPDVADVEQLQKTVKALTRRLGTVSAEKRELSTKLQQTIVAVPKAPAAAEAAAEAEGEQPQRADFKTQAEFDAAVRTEAQRVSAQTRALEVWNDKCNNVEDAGTKAFGKNWAVAKANLGVLDDEGRIPMDLLSTALETDNPSQVLFALGADIDKAAELMAMTPAKRAIAMDRLAQVKPAERQRSKAPDPIEPINGGGGGNDAPSDRDTDAEWHRKEGLREAARRKERLAQR